MLLLETLAALSADAGCAENQDIISTTMKLELLELPEMGSGLLRVSNLRARIRAGCRDGVRLQVSGGWCRARSRTREGGARCERGPAKLSGDAGLLDTRVQG